MSATDPDEAARRLAAQAPAGEEPTAWFERLYRAAEAGDAQIPWDRHGEAQQSLVDWTTARRLDGRGRRAVVVGFGTGEDAEHVADLGYATVAFDVAPTAVAAARRRFPASEVEYVAADLLDLPDLWHESFDLVVECLTVQSLPPELHDAATAAIRSLVAPHGTLLVVATARAGPPPAPPWPLTREEIDAFARDGLHLVRLEELGDEIKRWRAELRRG